MDIRNIQKTGNMHYIYLPTSWCKKYGISSDSKASLSVNNDGSITISPGIRTIEQKDINIEISDEDQEIIIKLIMACYVNPVHSFRINLKKSANISRLLSQKNMVAGFEFVELDGSTITYESSININEPYSLLKTMVKKINNMLNIMTTQFDKGLILKYEEEIDRSRIMITKSVTEALILNTPSKLKTIDLHYISLLASNFERLVDSLIIMRKKETAFFRPLSRIFEEIKELLENIDLLTYDKAIHLTKSILQIKARKADSIDSYSKNVIRDNLNTISEKFLNWAVAKQIDN